MTEREHCPFAATVTCDECPWVIDTPTGRFPVHRFMALATTSTQGYGPVFTCHKTEPGGAEHACVGWLLVDARENFAVRIQKGVPWDQLRARGPLYASYGDMAEANGVPAVVVDALGVRSARRDRPAGPESTEQLQAMVDEWLGRR